MLLKKFSSLLREWNDKRESAENKVAFMWSSSGCLVRRERTKLSFQQRRREGNPIVIREKTCKSFFSSLSIAHRIVSLWYSTWNSHLNFCQQLSGCVDADATSTALSEEGRSAKSLSCYLAFAIRWNEMRSYFDIDSHSLTHSLSFFAFSGWGGELLRCVH